MNASNAIESSPSDTRDLIMVSCYGDLNRARDEFDELARHIEKQHFRVRESVLVGKNGDGTPIVIGVSSGHHGRTGAAVGAGIGFLLGVLAMPVLPMTVAVGAAAGAAVAGFADHTLKAGLRHDIAEKLVEATAVVITIVSAFDELWARRALNGASEYVTVPYPESTIASLEQVVSDAMSVVDPNMPMDSEEMDP